MPAAGSDRACGMKALILASPSWRSSFEHDPAGIDPHPIDSSASPKVLETPRTAFELSASATKVNHQRCRTRFADSVLVRIECLLAIYLRDAWRYFTNFARDRE